MTPQAQPELYGHTPIEQELLQAWQSGRMPHSLLLTGSTGVGKATLAFRLARFLFAANTLSETPKNLYLDPQHPVFRRVASGGHGDLFLVQPSQDKVSQEISVDQVRSVGRFLSQTPLEGGWRVVIIDGAMNRNAANALLKVLEEPPKQAIVMVLAESYGRVAPTIRSRCQLIKLALVKDNDVAQILHQQAPDIAQDELSSIIALAQGSPGRALAYYQAGALELYQDMLDLFAYLEPYSWLKMTQFCEKYAPKPRKKDAIDPFPFIGDLLSNLIYRMMRLPDPESVEVISGDGKILTQARTLHPVEHWALVWQKITASFREAKALHLDRYQVLMSALEEMGRAR